MKTIRIASFNVWGVDIAHDVPGFLDQALEHAGPTVPNLIAVGFQEVWQTSQFYAVLDRWAGAERRLLSLSQVHMYYSRKSPQWKCLLPKLPKAGVPGIMELELSSGLMLCVKGTVKDTFFTKFRGGYTPDSAANKGILAALVAPENLAPHAILTTHFHDYSNDPLGGARRNNIETLANVVHWIDDNWHAPIIVVGDFNIDSISAHAVEPSVDTMLYRALLTVRKSGGAWWFDVNARANAPRPVNTMNRTSNLKAIDLHLLSSGEGTSFHTFEPFPCGSDHQLVRSSWEVA